MTHSISVAADGRFILECPLASGALKRVFIPANAKGMVLIRRIILADSGNNRIGEPAAPIQYDLDKLIAKWNEQPKVTVINGQVFDLSDIEL